MRLRQAGRRHVRPRSWSRWRAIAGRPDQAEIARSMLEDLAAQLGPPVVGRDDGRPRGGAAAGRPTRRLGSVAAAAIWAGPAGARAGPVAVRDRRRRADDARTRCPVRWRRRGTRATWPSTASGEVSLVASQEVTSYGALLAMVPDELRRAFAARVVGPVLDYDERSDAGLRETLCRVPGQLRLVVPHRRGAASARQHRALPDRPGRGAHRPRPVQARGPGRRVPRPALALASSASSRRGPRVRCDAQLHQ